MVYTASLLEIVIHSLYCLDEFNCIYKMYIVSFYDLNKSHDNILYEVIVVNW